MPGLAQHILRVRVVAVGKPRVLPQLRDIFDAERHTEGIQAKLSGTTCLVEQRARARVLWDGDASSGASSAEILHLEARWRAEAAIIFGGDIIDAIADESRCVRRRAVVAAIARAVLVLRHARVRPTAAAALLVGAPYPTGARKVPCHFANKD